MTGYADVSTLLSIRCSSKKIKGSTFIGVGEKRPCAYGQARIDEHEFTAYALEWTTAEGYSMTVADVVADVLAGEAGDFLREAVELVARELMEAEIISARRRCS